MTLTSEHTVLLDAPVWAALTTSHSRLAEGGLLARRYPPEIAPFAAIADPTPGSFNALAALAPPGGRLTLVSSDALDVPGTFKLAALMPLVQMVLEAPPAGIPAEPPHVLLGPADVTDMLDLTQRTRPGPFGPRTFELGEYIGIRVAGTLAAMAGERMRFGHFVEISAVCVDPDYRGKGYAALLVKRLVDRIQARSLTPILHVLQDNAGAIGLYEKLGFRARRTMCLNVLSPTESGA